MGQLTVAVCVKLQQRNTEDKSRGTTQTCTTKSNEKSQRSSRAGLVQAIEFSSQIPLPQTIGRDKPQCRGKIHIVFKVRMKAFPKIPLNF